MYYDNFNEKTGRAMGLSGPLVVMPADGTEALYSNGPDFDRQYTLVLNELDERLNRAVYNGQSYDMADYEPNYFMINGRDGAGTLTDPATAIEAGPGQKVLRC
jgi:hypothetical protein